MTGGITNIIAGNALTGGGAEGDITLNVDETAININQSQVTDVTATASEINTLDGITATTAELNYTDGVTSPIQSQIDGKQNIVSVVSDTEIGYLDGVSSPIQSQINNKQNDVITTQGDLVVGGSGGVEQRLGIGAADTVLTSDGTNVTWAAAGGGGGAGPQYTLLGNFTVSNQNWTLSNIPQNYDELLMYWNCTDEIKIRFNNNSTSVYKHTWIQTEENLQDSNQNIFRSFGASSGVAKFYKYNTSNNRPGLVWEGTHAEATDAAQGVMIYGATFVSNITQLSTSTSQTGEFYIYGVTYA